MTSVTYNEALGGLPLGPIDTSVFNNLNGFNILPGKTPVPIAKDRWGYTFFVRPQLNLQSDNIKRDRRMTHYLNNNPYSIHRAVRTLLDPRLVSGFHNRGKIESPLIDNSFAFISVLSNDLITLNGWEDEQIEFYKTKPGSLGQVHAHVDSAKRIYKEWNFTATFRNTVGKPVKLLIDAWTNYMSNVYLGVCSPYYDMIVKNEIDYYSRVYRIVLDQSGKYVSEIAATGVSVPMAISNAGTFDYQATEGPYNISKEITVGFLNLGAIYNDPILIRAFNQTVTTFNSKMKDGNRSGSMVDITSIMPDRKNMAIFKYRNKIYPRINPLTNRMEWWTNKV